MKYPIGTQTFRTLIEYDMVYVDKTDLVYQLAQKHVCFFCRPRRFGKSLLISTLESYFKAEKELFKGLKMETLEKEWKQYPVFRIDFSSGNYKDTNYIYSKMSNYLDQWEAKYEVVSKHTEIGVRFGNVIAAAHEKTGLGVVVLVDEYVVV